MPVWIDIAVNVLGYAGFVAIATFTSRPANPGATTRLASISVLRLARRAHQPICLD